MSARNRPQREKAAEAPRGTGRADLLALGAVLLLALLLRLVYVWQYRASPFFDHPVMDPRNLDLWARSILSGEPTLEGHPYFRAPLYPWFLAACYRISGGSYLFPRIVQALLGTVSCGLVFLIARTFWPRWAALIAGLAAASCWLFLYFEGELLIVSLLLFLDLLLIWQLLRAHRRDRPRDYALAGLILGLSALARPNILLFGVGVIVWILALRRRPWRARLTRAACVALAALIPILPVTARNLIVAGDPVLISSQGGLNLYIGNHPGSDGRTPELPGSMADWGGSYFESIAMAEQATGRTLRPSQVSAYFAGAAARFAWEQPAEWLTLTGKKIRYFWNRATIGNNQPIEFFARRYAPIVRYLPVRFGLIAPLGILGLLLALRDPRRSFPLWGFVLLYSFSVILFFVNTRFKLPVLPVLIVLAAGAVDYLVRALRERAWRRVGITLLVLLPIAWWVNTVPPELDIPQEAHGYEMLAMREMERGESEAGIAYFREALASEAPYPASLHFGIGHALLEQGKLDAAERELQAGLNARGRHAREFARGTRGLAEIAAAASDTERVIGFLDETVRLDPQDVESARRLTTLLIAREEWSRALPLSEHLLRVDPARITHWILAAEVRARSGQRQSAQEALREALRRQNPSEPLNPDESARLARLRAELDR